MGCFDSLIVKCPSCGKDVEFQSKAGGCDMLKFNVVTVPPSIAGNLNGETESCGNCGSKCTLHVKTCVHVVILSDMERDEDDGNEVNGESVVEYGTFEETSNSDAWRR